MDEAGVQKTALISHLTDPPETQKGDFVMAIQRFMFDSNILRPLGIAITKSMYKNLLTIDQKSNIRLSTIFN